MVLAQQGQGVLRLSIRNLQNLGRRIHQDLSSGQARRLEGKVGVANGAFRGRNVLTGHRERVDGTDEGVLLEPAKPATQNGDLIDRRANDPLGGGVIAAGKIVGQSRAQGPEETN